MSSVVIVGAGRVGCSLAIDLAGGGRVGEVLVLGRTEAADRPQVLEGPGIDYGTVPALAREAGGSILVFCVPDDALEEAAAGWAAAVSRGAARAPAVALHTSGRHRPAVLAPLRALDAAVGGCHPLVAVSSPGPGRFAGVAFGVDGDPLALERAGELARRVGGFPLRVRPEARVLYHAAAVFGANFPSACLAVARDLLSDSLAPGANEARVLDALLRLARSALDNLEREGLPEGLTGPVVRGDAGTVEAHIAALDPARRTLYRALGSELLRARDDRLPEEIVRRLRRLLAPGAVVDADSEGETSNGD